VGTSAELDIDGEPPWVFEEVEEEPTEVGPLGVRGPDIFLRPRSNRRGLRPVRSNRRDFLPVAFLRQGRHSTDEASRARARANHPCQGQPRLYLVDADGEDETTRIELRRRFEDVSVPGAAHPAQDFVAG
jgi:hypothetical protein